MARNPASFVHLHVHTEYSLLDGACRVGDLVALAEEHGAPAVAMTDHGVLYGAIDFYRAAHARGIKPLIGCEVYVAYGPMRERHTGPDREQARHLVLLAEDARGYQNLVRLVSLAWLEGFYYKPRIDLECLAAHHEGLIGLSACLKGEVATACARGDVAGATAAAGAYAEALGPGNFFLELQDHGLPAQREAGQHLREVARRTGLPLVATNDVHYLRPAHATAHEVLLCLQTGTTMSDPGRMQYGSDQFYFKTPEEMAAVFPDDPDALARTLEIASRCTVELPSEGELHFPRFDVPTDFEPTLRRPAQREFAYLRHLARDGLAAHYGLADPDRPRNAEQQAVAERFAHELDVIRRTGFVNYFLVVWDFVRFARERGVPVGPGRGSGAGSLVAYALGITGIDPLRYGLIFERFLNPERVSPPDFDIDFCQERRGEVIDYVRERYGRERVAQIITFGTLGAKTVIRDVGRALEVPLADCDRLAKMVPEDPSMTLDRALQANPELRAAAEQDPAARRILPFARVLEGLPRNAGTHAAGLVIGERPLIEVVPLTRGRDREVITQFDMKAIGQVGLLKMDFLGLKTLTVIREAVEHVAREHGETIDPAALPMDDAETFALLNRGDTVGVFQVESEGMRDLLRRIQLTRFEDLIAMIALYRPGPMNMLEDFVKRKRGEVPIAYDHPLLEPILAETYGVMLYQEQVQQAANVLAGFSMGQGDLLRRAMSKKDEGEMTAQREAFLEGCAQAHDIPRKTALRVFENISRFAGYGFNKSHSTAYAVLSYQTAWLKAHYPVPFFSALLSSETGNPDKLQKLIREVQGSGIPVLPPDVNESGLRFRPAGEAIRFGLAGVKHVGTEAVRALVAERERGGPYHGLLDFCVRAVSGTVNRKAVESLVKCGAFDGHGLSRGRLFAGLDFALNRAAGVRRDREHGQASLFGLLEMDAAGDDDAALPPGEPWNDREMLSYEKELVGFYISGHPLAEYAWLIRKYRLDEWAQTPADAKPRPVHLAGLVSGFERRFTKRDQQPFGVFRLETLEGVLEAVAFPAVFAEFARYLQDGSALLVCGQLALERETPRLVLTLAFPLEAVPARVTRRLRIHLGAALVASDVPSRVKAVLARHSGAVPVALCLECDTGEKVFIDVGEDHRVDVTRELIRAVEELTGEDTVYADADFSTCPAAAEEVGDRRPEAG